nr:hypothetical protein Itr_chr10CG13650 [Ipomoea trifida]GMD52664.1 hypothetical protein Iba_chr11bCG13790 [Ipomoea batatas]
MEVDGESNFEQNYDAAKEHDVQGTNPEARHDFRNCPFNPNKKKNQTKKVKA